MKKMKKISHNRMYNKKLYGTVPMGETIVAVSTPVGKSGIGIVRLSGKGALHIADKVFVGTNGLRPSKCKSHTLHYGWIINSAKRKAQSAKLKKVSGRQPDYIDEVLLTVMRGPKTYTREDIVEINCHSGIVVLKKILELLLKLGARMADPGEFTKRAYLNGRIDLAQAEAVLDVINSQTPDALKAALGQLKGGLSQKVKALRKNLLNISTQLEACIDFSDRDIQPQSQEKLLQKMDNAFSDLKQLLDTADQGTVLREGIACVICGKPNVGKSSLLNALLKRDRAIVTPMPGTTRDLLEETLDVFGIPLRLIDSAGIVRANNLAEKEAVKRSRKALAGASLSLLVLDASRKLTSEDLAISRYISGRPAFVVLNKQDLPAEISINEAAKVLPGKKVLAVSALYGRGLDSLEKEIADYIWKGRAGSSQEILISNIRHIQAIKKAQKFIKQAIRAAGQGEGAEIVALEIKAAQEALSEIIGRVSCEDILGRIFSQFCIGK